MMWKPFAATTEVYMLKYSHANDTYMIHLTDLKKIWTGVFSLDVLVKKFQEYNPLIDVKSDDTITQVSNMFHNIDKVQVVEVIKTDLMINLRMKTNISEFKIKYEVTLTKTEDEKFMEMITIPMIQTIHFLETQQKMLCNLIEKKDRELEEYQMEKGAISRSDLITGKFEPNTLVKSSSKLILNSLGNSEKFMEQIKRKYGKVEEDVVEVVAEVWNEGKKRRKIFEHKTPLKNFKIVYKE